MRESPHLVLADVEYIQFRQHEDIGGQDGDAVVRHVQVNQSLQLADVPGDLKDRDYYKILQILYSGHSDFLPMLFLIILVFKHNNDN